MTEAKYLVNNNSSNPRKNQHYKEVIRWKLEKDQYCYNQYC